MMSQVKKALTIAVAHVHPEFYGLSAKRFEVEVVCVCVCRGQFAESPKRCPNPKDFWQAPA